MLINVFIVVNFDGLKSSLVVVAVAVLQTLLKKLLKTLMIVFNGITRYSNVI